MKKYFYNKLLNHYTWFSSRATDLFAWVSNISRRLISPLTVPGRRMVVYSDVSDSLSRGLCLACIFDIIHILLSIQPSIMHTSRFRNVLICTFLFMIVLRRRYANLHLYVVLFFLSCYVKMTFTFLFNFRWSPNLLVVDTEKIFLFKG